MMFVACVLVCSLSVVWYVLVVVLVLVFVGVRCVLVGGFVFCLLVVV